MKDFSASKTNYRTRSSSDLLAAILMIFAGLLVSHCSPTLQKTSAPTPGDQDVAIYSDSFEAFLAENMAGDEEDEDSLAEVEASELEPLADEEIPLPEPEELASIELTPVQADPDKPAIEYDFPIVINAEVEFFLNKFQHGQRKIFRKWLERSGRYLPMIQAELKKANMPLDLAYLPMIESGYRLTAYSRARAVGPWQFMRGTGRFYKLTINSYVDERRDPIKSTKAAIKFLSDLYKRFDSWPLAVAGYNAGGGRINRAIRKTGSRDFWELIKSNHLKRETKYYVPKLIAAIIIARDPERYGFTDIEYDEPLAFETLPVPRWTTMQAVALAGDETLEDIRNLNRQLRRAITPPGRGAYTIKVPVGKKELVAKNLPRVRATVATGYKTHVIKKGDTVSRICRKYNISTKTLLKANNLRSTMLRAGHRLRIPYKTTSFKLVSASEMATSLAPAEMSQENLIVHKIRPGETISELARLYNVPAYMIAAWNGLENLHQIRAGQQLDLYLQDLDDGERQRLAAVKKKSNPIVINRAEVDADAVKDNTRLTYYRVRGGDSLWTIARQFQTTPEKIRRWNSIEGNKIFPGRRLLLKIDSDIDA